MVTHPVKPPTYPFPYYVSGYKDGKYVSAYLPM
jgi:hypothetical protein